MRLGSHHTTIHVTMWALCLGNLHMTDPGCAISDPSLSITVPCLVPVLTAPTSVYCFGNSTDLSDILSIFPHLPAPHLLVHQIPGLWPHGIDPDPLLTQLQPSPCLPTLLSFLVSLLGCPRNWLCRLGWP